MWFCQQSVVRCYPAIVSWGTTLAACASRTAVTIAEQRPALQRSMDGERSARKMSSRVLALRLVYMKTLQVEHSSEQLGRIYLNRSHSVSFAESSRSVLWLR